MTMFSTVTHLIPYIPVLQYNQTVLCNSLLSILGVCFWLPKHLALETLQSSKDWGKRRRMRLEQVVGQQNGSFETCGQTWGCVLATPVGIVLHFSWPIHAHKIGKPLWLKFNLEPVFAQLSTCRNMPEPFLQAGLECNDLNMLEMREVEGNTTSTPQIESLGYHLRLQLFQNAWTFWNFKRKDNGTAVTTELSENYREIIIWVRM